MLTLETERLLLRDFKESDLEAYREIGSAFEFQYFYSEEDSTAERRDLLLHSYISQANEKPRIRYQLAITSKGGELMGSCGVRIESVTDRQGSFGCELGHSFWKDGFGREASRAIIDFGFRTLKLHRIYAETTSENKSALTLASKLGMRNEGELIENRFFKGRWWNTTIVAILSSDWKESI